MSKVCNHQHCSYDVGDGIYTDWTFEFTDNTGKTAWQLGNATHDPLGEYEAAARARFGNDLVDQAVLAYPEPPEELLKDGGGEDA